jgi:hypothetical protein
VRVEQNQIAGANLMSKGRPSTYTPARCDQLLKLMAEGLSITAAAGAMGVHRDTLYEWSRRHPEFSDALKKGVAVRLLKLERELLTARDGPTVTARIFALKNAAPHEWREKQHIGHDVGAESPLAQLARELAGTAIRPKEN